MDNEKVELPLRCIRQDGELVVRIPESALAFATKHHARLQDAEAEPIYHVTDAVEWGKSVESTLNSEREDGSSLITDMLDAAILIAVEQGELGVDEIKTPT